MHVCDYSLAVNRSGSTRDSGCCNLTETLLNISFPKNDCGWLETPPLRERSYLRYLDLYTYPVLLLLATVGNGINLVILFRSNVPGTSRTRNSFLIAIAFLDLVYMWSAIFAYTDNYDAELHGRPRPSIQSVYTKVAGVAMFLQEVCVIASAWLIVAFSIERFLAIKYPLKYRCISHRKRALITAIISVAVAISLFRLVDYYWVYCNYLRFVIKPVPKPPRPAGLTLWYKTYSWVQAIIQIATFLMILTLNTLLLGAIKQQRRLRKTSLCVRRSNEGSAKSSDTSGFTMLTACVAQYLVTQIPGLLENTLYLLDKGCLVQKNKTVNLHLIPVQNLLINIYFSANFMLYCGVSSHFRKKVAALI